MKYNIIITILILILLTGCTITGFVAKEIEDTETVDEKDLKLLTQAIDEKDTSKCNYIQVQNIREQCFTSLAEILNDKSICDSLLPQPKNRCLQQFNS